MLDVPAQFHMLGAHQGYTTDTTHRKQTASHCGTIGDDFPIGTIGGHISYTDRIERDVGDGNGKSVDDTAQQSSNNTRQSDVMDIGVEPVSHIVPYSRLRDDTHTQHDAHDEKHLL